jgi:16S rRNA (adenine1518-N6/adenine1519-N6)-dimethyltransferase
MKVKPKKFLGQHFLIDREIALKIVNSLTFHKGYTEILEVGPGMGILTDFLKQSGRSLTLLDIDKESILFLERRYKGESMKIIRGDFLKTDLTKISEKPFGIIGNFPYNISSQIFFKVLDYRNHVQEIVGMVQKEVGDRIAAGPGSKTYGILSVLLSTFYDIENLFTVEPYVFDPPPKVLSTVIRLKRNDVIKLPCDEKSFKRIVKLGFQNRRKTLRNALKALNLPENIVRLEILDKRAEQLSSDEYINLTNKINQEWKN